MKQPCVFIVGAGPGDPSLITVRGRGFLQAADVVIYDHRVHRRLLRLAKPGAERIDVGAAAPKPLEQDAISLLLVEKAREGKTVVRLKWGDPFVFDSGGNGSSPCHAAHRSPARYSRLARAFSSSSSPCRIFNHRAFATSMASRSGACSRAVLVQEHFCPFAVVLRNQPLGRDARIHYRAVIHSSHPQIPRAADDLGHVSEVAVLRASAGAAAAL